MTKMIELAGKDFKTVTINMFKNLKKSINKIRNKRLKKSNTTSRDEKKNSLAKPNCTTDTTGKKIN